jgi:steroid delta-isomerase-like uncharacterized protein
LSIDDRSFVFGEDMTADLVIYADIINRAWNSHDIEKVLSFYSLDYVGSDVGQAEPVMGHEGLQAMLETYWKAFPNLHFTVNNTVVQGFQVVSVWQAEGTHQGPIMNIPPTGRKVQVRGVSIIEVKDGLVVRGQYIWDMAGMLRHMGLLPEL